MRSPSLFSLTGQGGSGDVLTMRARAAVATFPGLQNCAVDKREPVNVLVTELSDAIGADAAIALVQIAGGKLIRVPRRDANARAMLALVIGEQPARRLSERFGGRLLMVPSGNHWRAREIAELRKRGVKIAEIAEKTGVRPRRVFQILAEQNKRPTPTGQPPKAPPAPPAPLYRA